MATKDSSTVKLMRALAGVSVMGCLSVLDDRTGPLISLAILYFVPIVWLSWYSGRAMGIAAAVVAAGFWSVADLADRAYPHAGYPVWNTTTRLLIFVGAALLISELRRQIEAQRILADSDGLTGLSNRRAFLRRAEQVHAQAVRNGVTLCLGYVDVDGFKAINDTGGHAAGDTLLRDIAATMRATARDMDLIARLGGDEFVVLVAGPESAARAAVDRHERALGTMAAQRGWDVGFSVGVVTFEPPLPSLEAMMHEADARMYALKRGRRTGSHVQVGAGGAP